MSETAREIWADGPAGSPYEPEKWRIRAWGAWLEAVIASIGANGGSVYSSRAALYADLGHPANAMAWVFGDPTTAYNGIYQKIGSSGAGSWVRIGDLPYSFNPASDAGAGTPNAIQATTNIPVSSAQIIILTVFENNTGSPVTISFNGGTTYTVKDFLGRDLSANELQAGAVITGVISGSTFRLLYDQKYPYAKAVNVGAGTANAMVATIPVGIDFTDSNILIGLPVTTTNTATPVTVSFNGNSPLTIKTNSGNDPVVGGLVAGTILLGFVSGATFRLISDQASAAILAAAEAAADAAADYADFARNNWVIACADVGTGDEHDYLLTIDPGAVNNMFVVVGGILQLVSQNTYSLVHSGGSHYIRINVPTGIPFDVRVGNAINVGTPSDGSVVTSKLADDAVTYAKFQNISATLRLLGRATAGAGNAEELTAAQLRDLFLPAGSVIDSVVGTYALNANLTTQIPFDGTVPQITEGTEIISVSITPKSVTNKLRVRFSGYGCTSAAQNIISAVFRDAIASALFATPVRADAADSPRQIVGEFEFVPATTSAVTIRLRVGPGGGVTLRLNGTTSTFGFGGIEKTTLIVEEIKA